MIRTSLMVLMTCLLQFCNPTDRFDGDDSVDIELINDYKVDGTYYSLKRDLLNGGFLEVWPEPLDCVATTKRQILGASNGIYFRVHTQYKPDSIEVLSNPEEIAQWNQDFSSSLTKYIFP